MKKVNTFSFLIFLLTFLASFQVSAVTVTWTGNGPNNLWSHPGNWDLGFVPTSADDVVIPANSGVVRFNHVFRRARTVRIETGSTLRMLNNTQLRLQALGVLTALDVRGVLFNRGSILFGNNMGNGIFNLGTIYNRGLLSFDNVGSTAIYNEGTFYNRGNGTIQVTNSGFAGIRAMVGNFLNEGTIHILENGKGMNVGDGFENAVTGEIYFQGIDPENLYVTGTTAINRGLISFSDQTTSVYPIYISSGDTFINALGGEITIENSSSIHIFIGPDAYLENDGNIDLSHPTVTGTGIRCNGSGHLYNGISGTINFSSLSWGMAFYDFSSSIENYGTLEMTNVNTGIDCHGRLDNYADGTITFDNMNSFDLSIDGTLVNYECANIYGDEQSNFYGNVTNYGWITYANSGNDHSGDMTNLGVIVDPYERFEYVIDNQSLWVTNITLPQANVPYVDAFEINDSTTSLAIAGLTTDPDLDDYAGNYDFNTNTYTPNNAAIGATVLYGKAVAGDNGCTQIFALRVIGGVQPLANPNPHAFGAVVPESTPPTKGMTVSPNPSTGQFQVQLEQAGTTPTRLRLIDLHGRTVWTEQAMDQSQFSIDLTRQLAAGIYQLQALQNGEIISTEKVIVQPTF